MPASMKPQCRIWPTVAVSTSASRLTIAGEMGAGISPIRNFFISKHLVRGERNLLACVCDSLSVKVSRDEADGVRGFSDHVAPWVAYQRVTIGEAPALFVLVRTELPCRQEIALV